LRAGLALQLKIHQKKKSFSTIVRTTDMYKYIMHYAALPLLLQSNGELLRFVLSASDSFYDFGAI